MSSRFGVGRGPAASPAWTGGTSEAVVHSTIYLAALLMVMFLYSVHKQGPALGPHSYPCIDISHWSLGLQAFPIYPEHSRLIYPCTQEPDSLCRAPTPLCCLLRVERKLCVDQGCLGTQHSCAVCSPRPFFLSGSALLGSCRTSLSARPHGSPSTSSVSIRQDMLPPFCWIGVKVSG